MTLKSLIFGEDLKLKWSDKNCLEEESAPTGATIQEVFEKDRNLSGVIRWVMSAEEGKLETSLVWKNTNEAIDVEALRVGENLHLFISGKNEKKTDQFSKMFWNVFSQTFPGGLLFVSQEMKVIEISHNLLSILEVKNKDNISLSKRSVLERDLGILFKNDRNTGIYKLLERAVGEAKRSRTSFDGEVSYNGKNLRVICGAVFSKEEYLGSCIYIFDISDEVQKNVLIKERELMLFESAKLASLGEMAGGIAHEINNPLAIMMGQLNVVEKTLNKGKLTDEVLREDILSMKETTKRIAKVVQGMRIISRDSSDEEIGVSQVEDIIDDVIGVSGEKCKSRGINFEVKLEDGLEKVKVKCRRVQISQVLLNLLNNSIDAVKGKEKPRVIVDVLKEDNRVSFFVNDSGDGVPSELESKIFQPFFTTKDVGEGTGLGLSLSAKIIKEHESKLEINKESSMTSFTFQLPTIEEK